MRACTNLIPSYTVLQNCVGGAHSTLCTLQWHNDISIRISILFSTRQRKKGEIPRCSCCCPPNDIWLERSHTNIFEYFTMGSNQFCLFVCFFLLMHMQSFIILDNIDIRRVIRIPPFGRLKNQKTSKGDPYKMSNINVVQSCWNFAHLKKLKKYSCSQNLKSLTQKANIWWHNVVSRRFGKCSF